MREKKEAEGSVTFRAPRSLLVEWRAVCDRAGLNQSKTLRALMTQHLAELKRREAVPFGKRGAVG